MKNPITKSIYHLFVKWYYNIKTFRGGWILTHLFYKDYQKKGANFLKIAQAHLKGWSYNDWCICGITNENRHRYMTTRDYCSLHPFNGVYSSWIDDKLILKYILSGTEAGKYMPDYYYQVMDDGTIVTLMDVDNRSSNVAVDEVLNLLHNEGILALKLIKGSLGAGFYRVEVKDSDYYVNNKPTSKEALVALIKSLRGYIVCEYLLPHPDIAKYYDKSVGCLRYIIGKRLSGEWQNLLTFMRFGTIKSNNVENYNAGGVMTFISEQGMYDEGNMLDFEAGKNVKVTHHPDSNLELKGRIPLWEEVQTAAMKIANVMPQMTYMGIDFCITDKNEVKIIEINSLTSLDAIETLHSVYEMPCGDFFKERLSKQRS